MVAHALASELSWREESVTILNGDFFKLNDLNAQPFTGHTYLNPSYTTDSPSYKRVVFHMSSMAIIGM